MEFRAEAMAIVIRRLRKKRKLSQEVLSGLAGMERSHLGMVETGGRIPNMYTIWRIADALDMRPSELVVLIEEEMEKMGDS
ncbi:MAG: helix-turn-helix transcriptional regulator [Acutalibacter sp.]|jgi:transcriptional regulator with XRE-family HTH domain|uniref:helix-turn-helix domain-containing protein n=1 Tax=Acutalibacter sp. TaxID=1918636 RepID=UPI002172C46D|nr:helix-turn-helix transcriptional regulator [Acutalibacter sp.]MCI9223862.1 helix-turn-helix transcriptional regulator [Acutalibacter sp.]